MNFKNSHKKILIDLENVSKIIDNKLLSGINLKVFKGRSIVILGESGSGKSVFFYKKLHSVNVEIKIHKNVCFLSTVIFFKKDKLIASSYCIEIEKGESHEMLQDGDVIIGSLTFWQRLGTQTKNIINSIFKDHSGMKENVPFGLKEIRP